MGEDTPDWQSVSQCWRLSSWIIMRIIISMVLCIKVLLIRIDINNSSNLENLSSTAEIDTWYWLQHPTLCPSTQIKRQWTDIRTPYEYVRFPHLVNMIGSLLPQAGSRLVTRMGDGARHSDRTFLVSSSQASFTVRILRYELEKRLRSVCPAPLFTPIPGVTDFGPEDLGCLGSKVLG